MFVGWNTLRTHLVIIKIMPYCTWKSEDREKGEHDFGR
jgi:hypothetical protein